MQELRNFTYLLPAFVSHPHSSPFFCIWWTFLLLFMHPLFFNILLTFLSSLQRFINVWFRQFRKLYKKSTVNQASSITVVLCVETCQERLQQLRDIGITDDALARQALEVSGGDIEAALEFIFGDDDTVWYTTRVSPPRLLGNTDSCLSHMGNLTFLYSGHRNMPCYGWGR